MEENWKYDEEREMLYRYGRVGEPWEEYKIHVSGTQLGIDQLSYNVSVTRPGDARYERHLVEFRILMEQPTRKRKALKRELARIAKTKGVHIRTGWFG